MIVRRRALLAAALTGVLAVSSCATGPVMRGRTGAVRSLIKEAERNGAMRCAPRELAMAKAHVGFAEVELDQGQLSNAESHLAIAEPNAKAAVALSPVERCIANPVRDGDRDGDGIPDSIDKCPDVPENYNGFEDEDGCPDPDNDNDTVPDLEDFCPNTPGSPGGARPGCPGLVVVTDKEIRITQQIQFDFNKSTIKPVSFPILDEVRAVLVKNPKIKLEVQGHTDNVGSAAYNLKLSDARAGSVRKYLVDTGIDPSRLIAKGYGLTQPLVPNNSAKNRSLNRRVQFIRTESKNP